jgi:integrase
MGWGKQTPGYANIKSKRSRATMPVSTNPVYVGLEQRGLSLGYRRNAKDGSWSFRRYANGRYSYHVPNAVADDEGQANGETILSYQQAVAAAVKWNEQQASVDSSEVVTTTHNVNEAVEKYLEDKEREKRKSLYRDHVTAKAHIYPELGAIQLRKLTHTRLKAWRDALASAKPRKRTKNGKEQAFRAAGSHSEAEAMRRRQASTNRVLTLLKAALNHAKTELRWIATDAAWKDIHAFKSVDVGKTRFLSKDEVKAFIAGCESEAFAKLVKGALYTGGRYGELTRLRIEHFNEADSNIFIAKSKNGEPRHVYLNADAVAFFKGLCEGRKPTEYVFVKADGKRWQQSEQKRLMDAAIAKSKVADVTFHTLRHSYASNARMNGMPLDVLQQQLGHKDLRMTMRYAHIGKSHQQEQVERYAPTFEFAPTESAAA